MHLWHRWREVATKGIYRYDECRVCHKRRAVKLAPLYSVFDHQWVKTGEWSTPSPPPLLTDWPGI